MEEIAGQCNQQSLQAFLTVQGFGDAHMTLNMEREPILWMGTDMIIVRHVYDKSLTGFLTDVNGKAVFGPIE
jgi:hypothetical protein